MRNPLKIANRISKPQSEMLKVFTSQMMIISLKLIINLRMISLKLIINLKMSMQNTLLKIKTCTKQIIWIITTNIIQISLTSKDSLFGRLRNQITPKIMWVSSLNLPLRNFNLLLLNIKVGTLWINKKNHWNRKIGKFKWINIKRQLFLNITIKRNCLLTSQKELHFTEIEIRNRLIIKVKIWRMRRINQLLLRLKSLRNS